MIKYNPLISQRHPAFRMKFSFESWAMYQVAKELWIESMTRSGCITKATGSATQ